jgi:uncharacterized membrane protein HdeD (DUF308 family)
MKILKWLLPIAGLGIIALGVVAIFTPLATLVTMAVLFGIGIALSGISEIAAFISAEKENRTGMTLASGILSTLLGIWMIFGSGMYAITVVLPFIFAAWVMASGITRIVHAVSKKQEVLADGTIIIRNERKIKKGGLFLGALAVIFGFILMFNPLMSAQIVSWIIGVVLISHGFGTIVLFFGLRKLGKFLSEGVETDK